MTKFKLVLLLALVVFTSSSYSNAFTWQYISTIKSIEPTYLPNSIRFHVNSGGEYSYPAGGSELNPCSGQGLRYDGGSYATGKEFEIENIKLVYSGLLAAMFAQKKVVLYGNDDCNIRYIHIKND